MTLGLESITIAAEHLHRDPRLAALPGIKHGFTRRLTGVGRADANVSYSPPRDRDDAWAMRRAWLAVAGLDAHRLVTAHHVHGAGVRVVARAEAGTGAAPGSGLVGQADALVTAESGVVPMTTHADCMSILLCDPVRRVVATIHAGWRGTTADVAGATVRTMTARFGVDPDTVLAYFGPAIGACCYEVGEDVVAAWAATGAESSAVRPTGERWTFDLEAANRALLERAGLPASAIAASGVCTRCGGDEWFSHRGQGPTTGRYGAFIALADEG